LANSEPAKRVNGFAISTHIIAGQLEQVSGLAPMRRATVIAKQRIHIKIHWLANKFGHTLSQ